MHRSFITIFLGTNEFSSISVMQSGRVNFWITFTDRPLEDDKTMADHAAAKDNMISGSMDSTRFFELMELLNPNQIKAPPGYEPPFWLADGLAKFFERIEQAKKTQTVWIDEEGNDESKEEDLSFQQK